MEDLMRNFENFIKKDEFNFEKIYGIYGCKYCDEDVDYAFWDSNSSSFFWICSKKHKSEQILN